MDNKKLDEIIHTKLVPIQSRFKSYEKLANGTFRFEAKTFKKAAETIQEVIEITRQLAEVENALKISGNSSDNHSTMD